MPLGSLGLGRVSTLLLYVFEPSPQVSLLLPKLPPPLFSSMVGTMWPSQCSGSPHSMMVGLQSTTPSLSVQASVQSPPVEQVFQSLYPTMWYTLLVLWPPTAMGAVVLPWITSELVYRYKVSSQTKADGKYPSVMPNCVIPVAFTAPFYCFLARLPLLSIETIARFTVCMASLPFILPWLWYLMGNASCSYCYSYDLLSGFVYFQDLFKRITITCWIWICFVIVLEFLFIHYNLPLSDSQLQWSHYSWEWFHSNISKHNWGCWDCVWM